VSKGRTDARTEQRGFSSEPVNSEKEFCGVGEARAGARAGAGPGGERRMWGSGRRQRSRSKVGKEDREQSSKNKRKGQEEGIS
jgi:hypothetical protein